LVAASAVSDRAYKADSTELQSPFTPKSGSRVAYGRSKPSLSDFLEKNTKCRPACQEIADFS
jgi:hypothetical protein